MRPSELDPERWRRIDHLLGAALETPAAERSAFLAESCAGDEALRAAVEELLEAHEQAEGTFQPAGEVLDEVLAAASTVLDPESRRVGPFRLERELGRGGMGVVYLAVDTRLGRQVALKALPPSVGVGANAKQRLRAEARAVSRLDHPNIATLYEIGETDAGRLYLVFAHYEGETLDARIARGALPIEEALAITARIAAGLSAAHESGITHRDVKPSNVLLTRDGAVKLLDFGVAKVAGDDVTREDGRLGTIAYMSPEQASGGAVDHRTDLWSLGIVLYEMLTGSRPFSGDDPLTLPDAILHEEPEAVGSLRPDVPEPLERIVGRLLRKEPANRYSDAGTLREDLDALREGTTEIVPGAGRGLDGPRTHHLRRTRLGLVGLVVATVVVSGSLWLGRRPAFGAGPDIRRLAVLPLENMTGDTEDQYFVEGIHDALIGELGKIGAFSVISRTSVMHYRDSETTIPVIAEELGVDAVVEGSVFRQGDSLSVTVRLVGASPERQVWADRYDGHVEDVFAMGVQVARSIAAEAGLALSATEDTRLGAGRRVNRAAYQAYLRGRYEWERRNREGFDLARSYLRRAIEIDSTFAAAYAGLAETYIGAADWGLEEPIESFSRARDLAATAMRNDSTLPEAYAAMAAIKLDYDWDWQGAAQLASRAIELNPGSVDALRQLGGALARMGRGAEAQAALDRANELGATIPGIGTAFVSYSMWEFDTAIEHARVAEKFDKGLWQAPWLICLSLAGKGLYRQAAEGCENVLERFGRDNPLSLAGVGLVYALGGRRADALDVIAELEDLAEDVYVAPSLVAMVYGALGDRDVAFDLLDRAFEGRDTFLMNLRAPFFGPLRGDPRFDALARSVGSASRRPGESARAPRQQPAR